MLNMENHTHTLIVSENICTITMVHKVAKVKSRAIAYLFSGQGTQKLNMGGSILQRASRSSKFSKRWDEAREYLNDTFAFDLNYVTKDNPIQLTCRLEANARKENISHASGILNFTPFTQVALLTYHVATFDMQRECIEEGTLIAGHSLGEISALAALGVIPFRHALELVFKRGLLMSSCTKQNFQAKSHFLTYIANPERCGISEKLFFTIIEVIAEPLSKQRGEFLEITAHNVYGHQYVVSGSRVALSVLGNILSPEWRRSFFTSLRHNRDAPLNRKDTYVDADTGDFVQIVQTALMQADVNLKLMPDLDFQFRSMIEKETYITGSIRMAKKIHRHNGMLMPRNRELDNEQKILFTDSLDHSMGLNDYSSDGLRKRPWFLPIEHAEIPFHSSILNRVVHDWDETLSKLLPEEEEAYTILDKVKFIPNILGVPLRRDKSVHNLLHEAMHLDNIGETWTTCRSGYPPFSYSTPSMKYPDMVHSTLLKHLTFAVQWSDTLRNLTHVPDPSSLLVFEISPTRLFERMVRLQAKVEDKMPISVSNAEELILQRL